MALVRPPPHGQECDGRTVTLLTFDTGQPAGCPMSRLLAIDQGTTSTRAILFDAAAAPVAFAQQELPQIYPAPGLGRA